MNLISIANKRPLHTGFGIVIATYTIAFLYALVFEGHLDIRPIARGILALLLGWGAFSGQRWAGWVLAVLSAIWTIEQMMWGIRGYLDSFLFGLLLAIASIFIFLSMTRPVQRDDSA